MKTPCGLLLIGILGSVTATASAAEAPAEKREVLAEHETIAVFAGLQYRKCMGMTTQCPEECGDSGEFAVFNIFKYTRYQQNGKYGGKQKVYLIQVSDFHRKPKGDPKILELVRGFKPGDYVQLFWRHDYVTRDGASFPQRPIVKLEKLPADEAEKLPAPNLDAVPGKHPKASQKPAIQRL